MKRLGYILLSTLLAFPMLVGMCFLIPDLMPTLNGGGGGLISPKKNNNDFNEA